MLKLWCSEGKWACVGPRSKADLSKPRHLVMGRYFGYRGTHRAVFHRGACAMKKGFENGHAVWSDRVSPLLHSSIENEFDGGFNNYCTRK